MARPLRIQFAGAVYHVTCRGNEKKDIFRQDDDRRTFLKILVNPFEYIRKPSQPVLMTNHFHLPDLYRLVQRITAKCNK